MRDLTAVVMGILPLILLRWLGLATEGVGLYLSIGLGATAISLALWHIVKSYAHEGLVLFLALGLPVMLYIFVAIKHPVFLGLYYGLAALVIGAGIMAALLAGEWGWAPVGANIGFFSGSVVLVLIIASQLGLVYLEAGLMAAAVFCITRLCHLDLLSWLLAVPRWIYKGMEKIWY